MLQRDRRRHGRLPRGGGVAGDGLLPVQEVHIRSDPAAKWPKLQT